MFLLILIALVEVNASGGTPQNQLTPFSSDTSRESFTSLFKNLSQLFIMSTIHGIHWEHNQFVSVNLVVIDVMVPCWDVLGGDTCFFSGNDLPEPWPFWFCSDFGDACTLASVNCSWLIDGWLDLTGNSTDAVHCIPSVAKGNVFSSGQKGNGNPVALLLQNEQNH